MLYFYIDCAGMQLYITDAQRPRYIWSEVMMDEVGHRVFVQIIWWFSLPQVEAETNWTPELFKSGGHYAENLLM